MMADSSKNQSDACNRVSPNAYTKYLRSIGKKSAQEAYRENVALKLPVTYLSQGKVIQETPDGQKRILGTVAHGSSVSVPKGTVIRKKKNRKFSLSTGSSNPIEPNSFRKKEAHKTGTPPLFEQL